MGKKQIFILLGGGHSPLWPLRRSADDLRDSILYGAAPNAVALPSLLTWLGGTHDYCQPERATIVYCSDTAHSATLTGSAHLRWRHHTTGMRKVSPGKLKGAMTSIYNPVERAFELLSTRVYRCNLASCSLGPVGLVNLWVLPGSMVLRVGAEWKLGSLVWSGWEFYRTLKIL
jgi:hypothetical protein